MEGGEGKRGRERGREGRGEGRRRREEGKGREGSFYNNGMLYGGVK